MVAIKALELALSLTAFLIGVHYANANQTPRINMATQVVTVIRAITDGQGRAPIAVSTVAPCLLVTITPSLTA